MFKKITLLIIFSFVLATGLYITSEYLGVQIPIVTDLINSKQTPQETITFIPDQDGFGFRNYSGRYPEGNLTIAETRSMFGDSICLRFKDERCIPHPKVLSWIDSMNETMNEVGHCVGFTVSSNQIHAAIRPASELGADNTFTLDKDIPVLRTIAQGYASYYASNVWTQEVNGKTPSEIIAALLKLNEPVDIGIFYPEYGRNGHSVLGHRVVDQGNGIYHILVYDSNRPGEDNLIVIDTNEDTWFYAEGAMNPDQPSTKYQGDAETKSLTFVPISAYNQPLSCPAEFADLCPNNSEPPVSVLTIFGRGQVLAETADGQIGLAGDKLINNVPNGRFVAVRGELYSRQPPLMLIPEAEPFTLQVESDQKNAELKISVVNPAYSVIIDGLIGQPGQVEQLTFDPVKQEATFVSGGSQQPSIQFIFDQDGSAYSVQLSGLKFEAGQNLTVAVDSSNGDLQFEGNIVAINNIVVTVARITPTGESIFVNQTASILPGLNQALDLASWDGAGAMNFKLDNGGDGIYEVDMPVPNEPIADMLLTLGSAEATIESLQNLLPYTNETQTEEIANQLLALNFTGGELGKTYLYLPTLRPDDLAGTINSLNLNFEEIGDLLGELHLDDSETESVLNELPLTEEQKSAVITGIAEQQMLLDTLDEWEFINTDDPTQLDSFLAEQGLTDEQTDQFVSLTSPGQSSTIPNNNEETPTEPVLDPPTESSTESTPVSSNPEVAEACSGSGGESVTINFVNETDEPIYYSWIDFSCNEGPGNLVGPGMSKSGTTSTNHVFIVRNEAGEMVQLDTPNGLVYTYVVLSEGTVTVR